MSCISSFTLIKSSGLKLRHVLQFWTCCRKHYLLMAISIFLCTCDKVISAKTEHIKIDYFVAWILFLTAMHLSPRLFVVISFHSFFWKLGHCHSNSLPIFSLNKTKDRSNWNMCSHKQRHKQTFQCVAYVYVRNGQSLKQSDHAYYFI